MTGESGGRSRTRNFHRLSRCYLDRQLLLMLDPNSTRILTPDTVLTVTPSIPTPHYLDPTIVADRHTWHRVLRIIVLKSKLVTLVSISICMLSQNFFIFLPLHKKLFEEVEQFWSKRMLDKLNHLTG